MRNAFLSALFSFFLLPLAQAAGLSERDRADVTLVEDYLNSFSTLKAHFLQISDEGNQAEGTAYLSRPGRLRMQYDPPAQLVLVADGTFLIIDDQQHENPSYVLLGSTPAGLLVREKIKLLNEDLSVTKVQRQSGVLAVTIKDTSNDDPGELTLIFSEKPFQLRQWRILDAQGKQTTVSLFDVQTGIHVDKKLFIYKKPNDETGFPH